MLLTDQVFADLDVQLGNGRWTLEIECLWVGLKRLVGQGVTLPELGLATWSHRPALDVPPAGDLTLG